MCLFVFRSVLILVFTALCLGGEDSSIKYVVDQPGKTKVVVSTLETPRYGLKPAEAAAFHSNLGRFRDLLLAQPIFHPPIGFDADGYVRADHGGPVVKTAPVRGLGIIIYFPYVLDVKTRQAGRMIASPWQIEVFINNPGQGLDAAGENYFYEPKAAGQMNGFPLYSNRDGDELIVLSNTRKPVWVPLTREEYVRICIRGIEKELAAMAKERPGVTPEELAILSPKDRAAVQQALADDRGVAMTKQRLQRHQEVLARMSPQERMAQAQNGDPGDGDILGPQLSPIGKPGIGPAYVKPNPDFLDPSRPRSDLQLIVVKFVTPNSFNHDSPGIDQWGNAVGLRLWETLHQSDWKAISAALAK